MRNLIAALVSLVVGLGLGLGYAWGISPAANKDASPAALSAEHKAAYVRLAAQAFAAEGDVARARARLAAAGETDAAPQIAAMAQQAAAAGENPQTVRALAALASALGAGPMTATPVPSPAATATPGKTSVPTASPHPSVTPYLLPTHLPTPTSPGAFGFSGKQLLCDPNLKQPLIQVLTLGASGEPISGVEVIVKWAGGADHFFTGLKPELGQSYGDFAMQPDTDYTVYLSSNASLAVAGLAVETCTGNEGQTFPGSWRVVFSHP